MTACVCGHKHSRIDRNEMGEGSCDRFVQGGGAENVLAMLNTADRKIGHLSYLPPQSLLPSQ